MDIPKRYTVSAALPYANGPLHIGHLAGVYIPADIYVRYLRSCKRDVVFICGSDEHGAAITLKAKKEGKSPQEIVDEFHFLNKEAFADFGIAFDIYHRTSDPMHHHTAAEFFLKLLHKGAFEIKTTEQYFDAEAQQFLADRYISGTCPNCGYEQAYGDQCESCGRTLSPTELIHPKSTISGAAPELRETSHWYLPLENHETWLREWLETGVLDGAEVHNPATWKKQVLGQCKSWIDGGLQARAMTRDLDWGVKVPLENAEGKVLYVWLDAPIGYISATKAWAETNGHDWKPYWQDAETKLVHFLAKDNIVFHCIIFPVILKSHGGFILPENVPANEFLNLEGKKISTSRNWAVWLHEYLIDFPDRQDELRYVLNSIAPEFRDSEFTWADYQARVNNELVAVLGNFVNRSVVLVHKFFSGTLPAESSKELSRKVKSETQNEITRAKNQISQAIENYRFRDAQQAMMGLARYGNKLLTETEPWKLAKDDLESAGSVLNACLQLTANLAVLASPFLPGTAHKLAGMLNLSKTDWDDAGAYSMVPENHTIEKPSLLFQRVEDIDIERQMTKLKTSLPTPPEKPIHHMPEKTEVSYDDFMKMDIRIATILEAERVPKTDKLMKLIVDTGLDHRTIVSGIAEHYDAEELPGKQVSVLLNLAPRNIKGIDSQGMVLMAEDGSGELRFVATAHKTTNGAPVH